MRTEIKDVAYYEHKRHLVSMKRINKLQEIIRILKIKAIEVEAEKKIEEENKIYKALKETGILKELKIVLCDIEEDEKNQYVKSAIMIELEKLRLENQLLKEELKSKIKGK